ncbi:MAG: NAD-dependent epimerase/dehydratase family protein [Bdellovibrionota bacterium]|jgi:nucleoside-diphosphate-sugar epimerase
MKCIVFGGGGFLGKALCRSLVEAGYEVVSVSRGNYPELKDLGVQCVQRDISNPLNDCEAFSGAEVVFHTAAKVSMWGDYQDFFRVNVTGTLNIIEACRKFGIKRLVYTSSPSVIADETDLKGVDESYPYPAKHIAHYPATKMLAEKKVLEANGADLQTVVLRPHLIWGMGDTNLIPAVLEKARAGKLVCVGSGDNVVDLTFIKDCVTAHLCAAKALSTNPVCRGKAYFISQGDPVKLWDWIDEILVRNGLPKVSKSVPYRLAYYGAGVMELLAKIGLLKEPLFTRFLISEMATDHYFNIEAAKRDLGYLPSCSMAEALDLTYPRA